MKRGIENALKREIFIKKLQNKIKKYNAYRCF